MLSLILVLASLQPVTVSGQTAGGTPGSAILSVSMALTQPEAANAPGPMPLMLLKESFDTVLRKKGTSLAAWASACRMGRPACRDELAGVGPAFVNGAILDLRAGARFAGVPPGSYSVFGQTVVNNHQVVWDVRVDLAEGANAVKLDMSNAAPIDTPQPRAP